MGVWFAKKPLGPWALHREELLISMISGDIFCLSQEAWVQKFLVTGTREREAKETLKAKCGV